jgi:hypothetical protein
MLRRLWRRLCRLRRTVDLASNQRSTSFTRYRRCLPTRSPGGPSPLVRQRYTVPSGTPSQSASSCGPTRGWIVLLGFERVMPVPRPLSRNASVFLRDVCPSGLRGQSECSCHPEREAGHRLSRRGRRGRRRSGLPLGRCGPGAGLTHKGNAGITFGLALVEEHEGGGPLVLEAQLGTHLLRDAGCHFRDRHPRRVR